MRSHIHSLTLVLALLAPSAASAVPSSDIEVTEQLSGRDGEELTSYSKVRERFNARMTELETDTRAYISHRESEERKKLAQGYDALIASLEELELSKRDQAVEVFEQFLEMYPDSEYSSHVRFRLAELYFELQKERWLIEAEAYAEIEDRCFNDEMDACELLTEPPRIDLQPAIDLYLRIIEDNLKLPVEEQYEFLDGTYYMLGFTYTDPNSAQKDEDLAQQAFKDLVTQRPESDLADAAHLFLGNHYFDYNETDKAIAEYRTVYDKGPEGDYYNEAMYQLAWSFYKEAFEPWEYNRALDMFVAVLEQSEKELLESGRESDYKPDAVKYLAISFSDIADKGGFADPPPPGHIGEWPPGGLAFDSVTALDVAKEYFATLDEPAEWEWEVYVQLGENLTQLAKFEDAIGVYGHLQNDSRWVHRPENPDFQWKVAKLWVSGPFPDVEQSAQARVELTNRYNDNSEWAEANRSNPEALAKARSYIEDSLADVAIEYRLAADNAAKEGGDPEAVTQLYRDAAARFREYLDKFPISDDYYQQQWYLSDTLYMAGDYEAASKEYELLLKSRRNHEFGDGAVFQLMRCQKAMLDAAFGDKSYEPPEDAVVERTYPRVDGKKDENGEPVVITVYQLSERHAKFIEAADRVLNHKFKPPEEGAADYAAAIENNRAALKYLIAQIMFHHGRYDEARPRLKAVVEQYRATLEGSYAAGLLVDSFSNEGDLAKMRLWTKEFVVNPPGPPEMIEVNADKFGTALEGVAFKQCLQLVELEDREGAADCFIQFMGDFPGSQYKDVALYNAANSYQLVGKADKAIELFEDYVNLYPDNERSENLYFRIATTYESTFELKQAIKYYERLVKLFPENIDAANAWYNAAFLKIGIGDYQGAAKAFEAYPGKFPDETDGEKTYFLAGEQWEEISTFQAKKFYEGYLRKYGLENPDHAFEARHKLAEIYKAERNNRKYDDQLDQILADYTRLAESNPEKLGYWARHYAAESAFRDIQKKFEIVTADELPKDEQKALKLLTEEKPPEVKQFIEDAGTMLTFADFEYNSAAIYLMGATQLYFADLGFSLRPPEDMDPEMQDIFYEVLETEVYPQFYPVQEKAVELFQKVIDGASERGEHNEWVDKSQQALNELDPRTYPALKLEKRGGIDATLIPEVKMLVMEDPNAVSTSEAVFGTGDESTELGGGTDTPEPTTPAPSPETPEGGQ